jgi:hypothetical protein
MSGVWKSLGAIALNGPILPAFEKDNDIYASNTGRIMRTSKDLKKKTVPVAACPQQVLHGTL